MKLYGLIGKDISHSFSPDYFRQKFSELAMEAEYRLFDISCIDQLPEIIADHSNMQGLNVTIPYKRKVLPFLHSLDQAACYTGAVNTISVKRNRHGCSLIGYNTDVVGFEQSLLPFIGQKQKLSALVLGTGGSARAVNYVLRKLGIYFLSVTRNPVKANHIGYSFLSNEIMANYQLIINTTPLGMTPAVDTYPNLPYHLITKHHLLYDLVYTPTETVFLQKGAAQGAQIKGGLQMLQIQAEASWKIWKR